MSKRIKGITIELDGETKGLDKALADVNKRSRDLQKELSDVNRLLKFNPGNADLIAQKQKLLAQEVENTKDKLNRLKEAQVEVDKAFAEGKISEEQYRAFQREIIETESKLKHLEGRLASSKSKFEEFGESVAKAGEKMKDVGDKIASTGKDLSKKVTAPLLGIGAIAAKVGSDFEAGMSKVQAISGASGEELETLTAKAREMGATTQFSASEAADALSYMAMAGWKTTDMLDGIEGIMALAAASGEDLALTADILTDGLTAFGMTAADSGRFADVLAAASANANTNVSKLGESFKYVAPLAGALGYSAEDTALALGLMANAGIKSSQAGTSLKTMFANLAKPTKQMKQAMDELGISLTDEAGNMKSMDTVLQELRGSFGDLKETQQAQYAATIFGKEAMAGALAIINASEEDYNQLAEAINNSEGAAKQMADTMNDNLQGRLKEMKSALEEAAISIYENMQPALEKLVAFIQMLADWFNNLSPAAQNMIFIFASIAAAIGPVLVIIGTLISSIGSIMTVIAPVIGALGNMGGAFALLTNPITIAIAAITAIIAALVLAYENIDWFRAEVDAAWARIKEATTVAFEAIKEVISTVITAAVDFAKGILDKFKVFWDENGKAIMSIVKGTFNQIKSTIEMVMGIIKGIFEVVWPIIKNVVKVTWEAIKAIVKTGIDLVLGIIQTVMKILQGDWEGAWETIKETAKNIWDNVESFFKNIDLVQIGKDIIQGLINGIGSMAEAVWEKAKSIAQGIGDSIKRVLGIASPSKLMIQFGEWTGEGLAIGLENMFSQLKKVSEEMGDLIVPTMPTFPPTSFGNSGTYNRGETGQTVNNSPTIINNYYQPIDSPSELSRKQTQNLRNLALDW